MTDKNSEGQPMRDDGGRSFKDDVLAITFTAEAGKQMLESSTSVSEVLERLRSFLPAVGLEGCSLDATMSYVILSYWHPDQETPLTTMREIAVASPRLEVLAGTEDLLDRVEAGTLELGDALSELRELAKPKESVVWIDRIALLVSVFGWTLFLNGTSFFTLAVALLATAMTFPVNSLIRKFRFPSLTAVFVIALIVAAIPNLLSAAGLPVEVGPAVVAALYIYLPGRAFVSSVIDGLASQPLSSVARMFEALVTAGFLALGMLVGNQVGAGLGLQYTPDASTTPVLLSVLGAGIGVLGLAASWGMPRKAIVPTVGIATAGWLVVALTGTSSGEPSWLIYALAAGIVGLAGSLVSVAQKSPGSMYVGVAILPLVPGFLLYTSMLEFAQGDTAQAGSALLEAGAVSIGISIGVAVGLSIGTNVMSAARRVRAIKR